MKVTEQTTPEKKKAKLSNMNKQKLWKNLLHDERLAAWIELSKVNQNKTFCKFCKVKFLEELLMLKDILIQTNIKKYVLC